MALNEILFVFIVNLSPSERTQFDGPAHCQADLHHRYRIDRSPGSSPRSNAAPTHESSATHIVDRNRVEYIFRIARYESMTAIQNINDGCTGVDPFVPSFKRKRQRRFNDGWTYDRDWDPKLSSFFLRELLTQALRIGVRVGPAPHLSSVHTFSRQLVIDPTRLAGIKCLLKALWVVVIETTLCPA